MASQSTGIQQLLVAEKKAADKVGDARKRKAKRLKQAKEEAQAEIEKYRSVGNKPRVFCQVYVGRKLALYTCIVLYFVGEV